MINGGANLATGDQIYDFVINQGYTTNTGTVTSVATTHAGNAFTASIGNVSTVNPSVDITLNGSASQYIDGAGNLTTFPTITTGTVESVGLSMPAAFSVANSPVTTSGTLTVTGAGTTSQYVRGDGTLNTFPTIPTVPANIVETVTTTDGTFINLTPNTATDGAVTVTADLSATGTPSSSTYLRGDNTWAAISGGFTSFDITGGSGSAQTITNGNTVTLAQGTGISTVAGATDTVTITNTLPFNSLTLAGDSGASQSITNNNTITLAGGTGLSSVASATDTVTFNANVDGVQSVAAETSTTTADRTYKVQVDSSDNLVVNVPWTGIGGSIASQQIAFGTGTDTIGGESDLIYNSSNNTLSVGSGTGSGSIYTTGNVTAEANFILGAYVYHNGDTNTFFGFPANDTFTINTNGLERLRIASAGQIGIGGTNYGTSGNVLTSNGPSAAPSWQAAGGSSYSWTIQGDSGSEAVASGDTIDFAGGTNITTSYDTTSNTLTINSSAGGATDLNGLSDCKTTSGGSVYVGNALPFATGSGNTYLSSSTSYLRAGTNNTAVGVFSGVQTQIWPDTLYTGNTTIGYGAAQQATTGCDHIVAIGESAGKWADGTGSVCIGTDSGSGASAVSSNGYNGDASIAIGYKANALSGMASNRIVIGAYAGYNMYRTAGATDPNLAIGYRAMYGDSLYNNSSYNNGEGNTVIGSYAMEHTTGNGTTADFSTIIGYKAGQTTFTGNGNVLIGVLAEPSTTATGNQCTIRVGTDSSFGAYTARFSSGISSWTFASDVRLKENIEDLDLGLDFINKLKPRKFKWKDSDKNSAGFIAQEVLDIEKEHNSENYSNIINVTNPDNPNTPCLLYTSPSPRDRQKSRMPSSA